MKDISGVYFCFNIFEIIYHVKIMIISF